MVRRRAIMAFKAAKDYGTAQDELLIPEDVDPQVEMSRNTVTPPHHVIIDEDTVLAFLSGDAVVSMKDSSVNSFKVVAGDNVYVPAGTPHRIEPVNETVAIRYTSNEAVRRGAAFFCAHCGTEMRRYEWLHDGTATPGDVYAEAARKFDKTDRLCDSCGTVATAVDFQSLGWAN